MPENKFKETDITQHRIGWYDGDGKPSLIHRVITINPDMNNTLCGYSLVGIKATCVPTTIEGEDRYCRVCFEGIERNLSWRIDDHADRIECDDVESNVAADNTDTELTHKELKTLDKLKDF